MKWIELSVDVHPEAVDAVSNVFHDHDTGGVAIHQAIQTDREGEVAPVPLGTPIIRAYLPVTDDLAHRERQIEADLWHLQAFGLSPIGPLRRREVDEEDWANGWKEHFHPLKIGKIVIKPSWREWSVSRDELIVELDPGMAFGTGLHPTTSLVLRALQARVRPGMRVLDLGTGSGILSIPAALLGAEISALDTSEVAVNVARQNAAANKLSDRIDIECGSIEYVAGRQFDLILANIIAGVLIDLAPQLAAALEPGAELLASGIIEERAASVRQAFVAAGLQLVDEQSEGDWWLIIARRPG
jgi:ribosomal protein L11 methyltransferase